MPDERQPFRSYHPRVVAVVFIILTLLGVGMVSRYALLTVILDGLAAMLVVVPPALAGLWLVPLFRLGPVPLRWHFLLGGALGIGGMSLAMLLGGLLGFMGRPLWVVVTIILLGAGIVRVRRLLERSVATVEAASANGPADPGAGRCLWLLVVPFLSLGLLAASNAPGFIWSEEGYGYDVLEYHLQLPKEYRQAGEIDYLPHNVYGNFPANVEMLYLLGMILQDGDVDTGVSANLIHLILGVLTVYAAWVAGREWSPRAGIVAGVVMATAGWFAYLSGLAYVEHGLLFFATAATAVLLRLVKIRALQEEPHHQESATAEGTKGRRDGGTENTPSGTQSAIRNPQSATAEGTKGRRDGGTERTPSGTQSAIRNPQSAIEWRWIVVAGLFAGLACGCKYTALPMIALPLGLGVLLVPESKMPRRLVNVLVFAVAVLAAFSPWLIKNQMMTGNPVFPLANGVFDASPPGWGEEESARWDRGHRALPTERAVVAKLGALWRHVPNDRYQRFGPVILGLGFIGLWGRPRQRTDLILAVILIVQLMVWLFATHLYARFAVVLLIPLALLAGRAPPGTGDLNRLRLVVVVIILGGVWNFAYAARLHRAESPGGAPAALIYEGEPAGEAYYRVVNRELPPEARVLLVGDARAFYFQREVDYCVVFNRNPFAEAVRVAQSEGTTVDWLRRSGYTHVLVNWPEVNRLRRSYGFAPEITPELFTRLCRHGLSIRREFAHPDFRGEYVTLYHVAPSPPGGALP